MSHYRTGLLGINISAVQGAVTATDFKILWSDDDSTYYWPEHAATSQGITAVAYVAATSVYNLFTVAGKYMKVAVTIDSITATAVGMTYDVMVHARP